MSKIKEALEKLSNKIAEKINDAASLEVVTFSGEFKFKISDMVDGDQKLSIEKVMNSMNTGIEAEIKLVAYSIMKIDGDQINIVKENLTGEQVELVKFHREMIEASQLSRKATMDMIKSLI